MYALRMCCVVLLALLVSSGNALAKRSKFDESSVSAINLDVVRVDACARGKGCVVAGGPMQVNLLDMATDNINYVNQVLLPEQTKALRLILGDNSTITVDDEVFPLTVPSGKTTGLKLRGWKVFGNEGGFLSHLTLDLNLQKQLVVREKKSKSKGKGKGKKGSSDDAVSSYKLKPVIKVATAEVEALPENMAAVVTSPDEDSDIRIGEKFSLFIPAGAVSEPTVITAEEIRENMLSPVVMLGPEGIQFSLPLTVTISYDEALLPEDALERHLVILHDGIIQPTFVDEINNSVTAEITHFTPISIEFAPAYADDDCIFEDIDPADSDQWYAKYVAKLCEMGIEQGYIIDGEQRVFGVTIPGTKHPWKARYLEALKFFLSAASGSNARYYGEGAYLRVLEDSEKVGIVPTYFTEKIPRKDAVEYLADIFYGSLLEDVAYVRMQHKQDYVEKMIEWGLTSGSRIYPEQTDCSKTSDSDCLTLSRVEAAALAMRAYERTPLENEGVNTIDRDEMIARYLDNIERYDRDEKYHSDDTLSDLLEKYNDYSGKNGDNSLKGVADMFDFFNLDYARNFLNHFLDGSGTNITISIEEIFKDNIDIEGRFKAAVKSSLAQGIFSGIFRITQQDWGILQCKLDGYNLTCNKAPLDWHYAVGTLDIVWQVNRAKTNIVLYVNNPYSFNIREDEPLRATYPLYREAANQVISNQASDYYIVGRMKRNISWITLGDTSASKIPIVTSVTTDKAVQNELTTFTVTGQDLPFSLVLRFDGCDDIVALGGTPTSALVAATSMDFVDSSDDTFISREFACTPNNGTFGRQSGSVEDSQGSTLYEFYIDFEEEIKIPEVTSVSPNQATLDELTTFTVTGSNLPSGLAFFIEECEDLTSLGGTSTSMQFRCTPSWTIGVKNGVVKDETGGNILYDFTVNVSDDTPEESFTCTSGSQTQIWQGREWQRCDDGNTYLWQEAKDYCDNLVLGGYSDWRLPTKDELKSLVVCTNGTPTPLADYPDKPYGCGNNNGGNDGAYDIPTIDPAFECHPELYWSSTPKEVTDTSPLASKELAWDVYFYYGYATWDNPNTAHAYVRCVR